MFSSSNMNSADLYSNFCETNIEYFGRVLIFCFIFAVKICYNIIVKLLLL